MKKKSWRKSQNGKSRFRAGRSILFNAFTLKIALEKKRVQRNRETHVALLDLEKVYDSVPLSRLWIEMENLEANPVLIQATQKYYEQTSTRIKLGNKVATSFKITKGL